MSETQTVVTGGPVTGASRPRRWNFDRISFFAVFLILPLTIFGIFVVSPFVQSFYYSFTDWGGFTDQLNFVGLRNFERMPDDPILMKAVRNSLLLAAIVPTITLAAAFAIAVVVTSGGPSIGTIQGLKGSGFYRVVSFFPYCVPAIVIGIIFAQVYDPNNGLLNGFLRLFGLQNVNWLGSTNTAMGASIFVIVWSLIGFYSILFVAAIKGIPAETYEAARLDGASRWKIATRITAPQIIPSFQTAYIYLGLAAIDSFVYMFALNAGGGPDYATLTISQYLYKTAFEDGKFGYATAIGMLMAVLTLIYAGVIFLIFRLIRGKDEGGHA